MQEWDGTLSKVRMVGRMVGIKTERYGDGEMMAGSGRRLCSIEIPSAVLVKVGGMLLRQEGARPIHCHKHIGEDGIGVPSIYLTRYERSIASSVRSGEVSRDVVGQQHDSPNAWLKAKSRQICNRPVETKTGSDKHRAANKIKQRCVERRLSV
jgi:hypothetical protein